jgi:diguanylate cyclase (GGDEF)-like protein
MSQTLAGYQSGGLDGAGASTGKTRRLAKEGSASEPTAAQLSADAQAQTPAAGWSLPLRLAAVAAGVIGVAWVWRVALWYFGPGAWWLLVQVPLGACTACLAWRIAARHERQWIRPARQLQRLIEEVREGQTPIESLGRVDGPMSQLARMTQAILHELRREEQENKRLHTEINQRVRQRTDALESKMATWQTQAYRDALTGLHNRRLLDEQLPKILERCRCEGTPLCVLAMDLDHFKSVNDTEGHAVGDRLLRDVGQIILSAVREEDMAFRLGGDEFLILMPAHDARAGARLAKRLTALVDQLAATLHLTPKPGLSIGMVSVTDLLKVTAPEVMQRADEAMYEQKSARKAVRRS